MNKTVMIFGLGHIGGWALELLARSPGVNTIVTVARNEEYGRPKTNLAEIGAAQLGYLKHFEFYKNDVNNVDQTAELLRKVQPDVVYSALSPGHSPKELFRHLPQDLYDKLWNGAGFGPWHPWNILPILKLMQAVEKSRITAKVLTSSLAEVENPVLWRNNLRPTTGIGGIDNQVMEIRKKVSVAEKVPISEVIVCLIAPHSALFHGPDNKAPFYLKIMVRDRNVTSKFDTNALVRGKLRPEYVPAEQIELMSLTLAGPRVSSSAVKQILAIINDTDEYMHSCGPNGLPGAYPVRINANGVEVVLPEELTLEEATKINNESLKWDGIEEIKDDGTVVFTEKSYRIMKEMLGYDCREVRFEDIEERAKELSLIYKRLQSMNSDEMLKFFHASS
ncbi:hypothetical protein ACFLUK_02030 [Chloroflexota bacterium]